MKQAKNLFAGLIVCLASWVLIALMWMLVFAIIGALCGYGWQFVGIGRGVPAFVLSGIIVFAWMMIMGEDE